MSDLISRHGVSAWLESWGQQKLADMVMEEKRFPSADRPKGEWIEIEIIPEAYDIEGVKSWASKLQCDQCGFIFTAIEGHITQYNFCPNCGADMRGEENV